MIVDTFWKKMEAGMKQFTIIQGSPPVKYRIVVLGIGKIGRAIIEHMRIDGRKDQWRDAENISEEMYI